MRTGGRHFLVGLCEWRRHDNIVRVVDEWLLVGRDEIRTEEVVVEPQGITTWSDALGHGLPKVPDWMLETIAAVDHPGSEKFKTVACELQYGTRKWRGHRISEALLSESSSTDHCVIAAARILNDRQHVLRFWATAVPYTRQITFAGYAVVGTVGQSELRFKILPKAQCRQRQHREQVYRGTNFLIIGFIIAFSSEACLAMPGFTRSTGAAVK